MRADTATIPCFTRDLLQKPDKIQELGRKSIDKFKNLLRVGASSVECNALQNRSFFDNVISEGSAHVTGLCSQGSEVMEITGYVSKREFYKAAMHTGFAYLPENDCFTCMKGHHLNFKEKTSQGYYRVYSRLCSKCKECEYLQHCAMDRGRIRINASPFYPAFYANMHRCETRVYKAMKRLHATWSEGTFAALKREHNLQRIRKRDLNRMNE